MKRKKLYLISIFAALSLVILGSLFATGVRAVGPVRFFLSPASGSLYAGQENIVEFRIDSQGEQVTGVEIQFQYLMDKITITGAEANADAGVTKVEMSGSFDGGRYYMFLFPNNVVSQNTVIARLRIRAVASSAAGVDVLLKGAKASTERNGVLTLSGGGVTVQQGLYNIGSAPSPTPVPSATPTPTPTPTPPTFTREYRIAEDPSDFVDQTKGWKPYNVQPIRIDNLEFKDKNPGQKFIWVEFKDTSGKIERRSARIKLLGPNPSVGSCNLSFEGNNTTLTLQAGKKDDGSGKILGFGPDKGTVKSGDTTFTAEQIKSWKNDKVEVVWLNAPEDQILPISLTNSDGQSNQEGQFCGSISAVALGAKVFCRMPLNNQTDNIDLILVENSEGGKKIKKKVSIDKDGLIQGLPQRLEKDKSYTLSLKAPRSIRKNVTFTAGSGITNLANFLLPVGDIFPADGGDGKINNYDRSELVRQWSLTADTTGRSGDFNRDGRINTFDMTCMKNSFNQSDEEELAPGVQPSATASPSSSPTPSPSVTPGPTATPGP